MSDMPVYSTMELKEMLKSTNAEEQGVAARRIWTDWNKYSVKDEILALEPIVLDLLRKDVNQRNSWHYMISLGLMNSKEAIGELLDRLKEANEENIRGFAADALARYESNNLSKETIETLWNYAENDPSLVVRVNSIRACTEQYKLTKNGDISIRLFKLLNAQSHSAVQTTILQQIGEIGSLELVPDLIHMMITRRTEFAKKMAGIALDTIAKINGYNDRKDLIKLIGSDEKI